jgi:hypothetical protein
MSARERLHQVVDLLADSDLPAALRVLEHLRGARPDDPVRQVLMGVSEDDQRLSSEEEAALDRALEEIGRGETKSWQEVRQGLG